MEKTTTKRWVNGSWTLCKYLNRSLCFRFFLKAVLIFETNGDGALACFPPSFSSACLFMFIYLHLYMFVQLLWFCTFVVYDIAINFISFFKQSIKMTMSSLYLPCLVYKNNKYQRMRKMHFYTNNRCNLHFSPYFMFDF